MCFCYIIPIKIDQRHAKEVVCSELSILKMHLRAPISDKDNAASLPIN
jgi:hypothetical protein